MAAFTQLLDRGLAGEGGGALAAWNPAMDLLALAMEGQVAVHRLNWQRLWWASPDAPVTALEWRPDGKQLAVGLEDGSVLLLNTEDGEVAHRRQLLPTALVAISWTEAAPGAEAPGAAKAESCGRQQQGQQQGCWEESGSSGGSGRRAVDSWCGAGAGGGATAAGQLSEDRARRMFAPPPPPVPPASTGLSIGYGTCGKLGAGGAAWPAEPARLAVLACASCEGELALCTAGLFPLATLRLPSLLGCPAVSVLRLCTAPNLQQLAVCWREGGGGGGGGSGPVRLSVLSTAHVGAHASQLHRLALGAARVESLLEGCVQSFEAACKEWQAGQKELAESHARLASLMSDYGSLGDPAAELQGLVATGAVGGALQQYITSTLGEGGLKKLARAVDAAVCTAHNLLTDHLQPQAEQLAFRLGELRGLALCLPWRRVTGLQPDRVAAAEQAALRLVMRAEAVRRRVVQVGAEYRTFFSWLLITLRRMQEDAADALAGYPRSHLDAVSDFLAGQYRCDAVGPLLGSCGGGDSKSTAAAGGAPLAASSGISGSSGCGGSGGSGSLLDVIMDVLGQQAPVQAADSTAGLEGGAGGHAGGSPTAASSGARGGSSLGQLLSLLQSACAAIFEQTSTVIGPTVQLVDSLALGPSSCTLAARYHPSGGSGSAAAAAVAWEGQRDVLLLRGAGSSGGELGPAGGAEAALVQVPAGSAAVDLAFYKDSQLALLLAGQDGVPSRLALVQQDALRFTPLPAELLGDADALQLCGMLLESEGADVGGMPEGSRQRVLPYPQVHAPLAVSASRGVACVLGGTQRVLLFDLEEDEEEEGEEVEELVDAHEGHDMDSDAAFESPISR